MEIKNHLIPQGLYQQSPNTSGPLVQPTLLVMHYTASGLGGEGDAKHMCNPAAKASAHVVVDAAGKMFQIVPFNKKAWHAGVSIWRGKKNCNDYSIGIEVDNWGILTKRGDGSFASWTGTPVPANQVIHAKNKRGIDGYWQAYPEAQLRAVQELTEAILEAYPSIREVVGHEDIAPGRKTDPGPAFPLQRYANLVGGRGDAPDQTRTVQANQLNLREAASPTADVLAVLTKGTQVTVLYDGGDWSQVKAGDKQGWVADQWLS